MLEGNWCRGWDAADLIGKDNDDLPLNVRRRVAMVSKRTTVIVVDPV